MQVVLDDEVIDVIIERKKIKNIYFRFKDNSLYVTCHKLIPEIEIKRVIKQNESSLIKMKNKVEKKQEKEKIFTYLGKPHTKVFDESLKHTYVEDGYIYSKNETQFNNWYKKECINIFEDRINYLLPYFSNIPKFSLRTRKMTTRWGVNNVTKRIITLNTELLKKDVSLIDYVIVHELCHFYEPNHSQRFWYQVSLRYPNYKQARKELRS